MQQSPDSNNQQIPTYSFNPNPTYSRFLFFLGMTVAAIFAVGILTAVSERTNPIANSNQEKVEPKPVEESTQQPIIVTVPEQPQQPQSNNDLGLTLEEYSNLSDPSPEVINCLRNEGGKGCFKDDYRPTQPQPSRYYSANNSQAVSVMTGRALPYWKPSSLPPIQGCLAREYLVRWQGKTYCGRRLIKQY